MQFDPRSQFGIIIQNEYANDTVVKLTLRGIVMGVPIRTPINEDMETLTKYKITSPLFCDPYSKLNA